MLPPHLNTDLLKSDVRQEFPPPVLQALEELMTNPPPDPDEARRVDLRGHKVYTIDSSDTVEVSPASPSPPAASVLLALALTLALAPPSPLAPLSADTRFTHAPNTWLLVCR